MNVIDELGILAISTRLQRMSERLRRDGVQIYKLNGIAFEPKWFPVIYTLQQKPLLGVMEIANEIGYTHPSTISLLKELEKQQLVKSVRDKTDERKRLVRLTPKATALIADMQPVWRIMTQALAELTDTTNNLLQALNEVEEQLEHKSFLQRAKELMKEEKAVKKKK